MSTADVLAVIEIDSFKSEQLSQPLHLSLQVMYQPRVRVLVDNCLTHDLLRSVCIPTHTHTVTSP